MRYWLKTPNGRAAMQVPWGQVSNTLLRQEHYPLPWWYRPAYVDFYNDTTWYAVVGFGWLVKLWFNRWAPFRLLTKLGFWDVEPGGLYRAGHFTPRYWVTLRKRYDLYIQSSNERADRMQRLALEWEATAMDITHDLTHWRETWQRIAQ